MVYKAYFLPLLFWLTSCGVNAEEMSSQLSVDGVGKLSIHTEKFDPGAHDIKKCGDYVCIIDKEIVFGADGNIPKYHIQKITFSTEKFTTILDVSGMYEPGITDENIDSNLSIVHYWGDFYKVQGMFSDGSGTYVAQWIVTKNVSTRTHISDLESFSDLATWLEGK